MRKNKILALIFTFLLIFSNAAPGFIYAAESSFGGEPSIISGEMLEHADEIVDDVDITQSTQTESDTSDVVETVDSDLGEDGDSSTEQLDPENQDPEITPPAGEQEEIEKEDEIGDAMENIPGVENISPEVANIELFDTNPSDIQLTAEITEAGQTVTINKYFSNSYTVDRGDDSSIATLTADTTHTYTTAGEYQITLSLAGTASRWTFGNVNKPLVPTAGTTATNIYLSSMPSLADYFGANATNPGDFFFFYFNSYGALTSLPEGSFDTSNITIAGDYFFYYFNRGEALTSLPERSFNTSNITTVGTYFFYGFNQNGKLTSLPAGSFNMSKITTAGNEFFAYFNGNGALTSLPEGSFDTSNITTVGDYFFYSFNYYGALTSLPEGSFDTSNITTVGDNFFYYFNRDGALTSLPEGSFNTSNITTAGDYFFYSFNCYGALTSLPEGSFDTSKITTVGRLPFQSFNFNGNLIKANNSGVAIKNLGSYSENFYYKTPSGQKSDSIPKNSIFQYYATATHTVDFRDPDGTLLDSQIVADGDQPIAPAIPQREGHIIKKWYQDAALTQIWDFTTPVTSDLTLYVQWGESTIQLTAEISAANQTVEINKYFSNAYTVDRGDGSPIVTLSSDTTHTYTTAGEYTITLSLASGASRWTFGWVTKPLVSKSGTTASNIYLSKMPSLADFGNSATTPGDYFFSNFNRGGALTSLPERSFDTSKITRAERNFFAYFNYQGGLTSLPEGSFDTSNITIAGNYFFQYFNYYGALTSLPEGSFDTSKITTVGNYFFQYFNNYGALTSLPEGSFDTSNITTVGDYFFGRFNGNGALTSLPEGSFDTSNIRTTVYSFFQNFNENGALTSLPEGSFDTSNITTVGNYFFSNFNQNGALTSLPEGSFNTSNITTVGTNFFLAFNNGGDLIKANTGIAIYNPSSNDVTFHYKNADGSVGSGTITAGSSFEYYPMMTSYTISFKDTDGSLVASKKVVEGTTVIAPADPERESYTFIGWYTDAELTTEYNFATPVTTDLTLYAKWEKIATTPSENNTTSSSGGGGGFGTNSKSENSTSTHTSTPEGPSFPKTEIDTTSILQNLLKEQLEKEVSTPMQLEKLAQVVASAQQAPVSQELKDAYIYAYLKGITTMDTVESAELDRGLTRAELAKMMVVVAQNLGKEKKVDTSASYADTTSVTGDLADYIQQAYQMQIMGIDADGNPLENFNPHGEVSRAEFATVLSRVLFGDQYNQGTEDYYSKHLEVLKNKGILQQDNPHIKELRGWVMLMLMRAEQLQN